MVPTLASPAPCSTNLPTEVPEESDVQPNMKQKRKRQNMGPNQRVPKRRASPFKEAKDETSGTEDKHQEMTTKQDTMENAETFLKDDSLKEDSLKDDAWEDQEGRKEQQKIDTKEPEEKKQPDRPEVMEIKIEPVDKFQESEAEQTKEEPEEKDDQEDQQYDDQLKIEEATAKLGTEEAIDKGPLAPNTENALRQPDAQLSPGTQAGQRQRALCSQPKFIPREGNEQDARIRAQRDRKNSREKKEKRKSCGR